MSVHVCVPSKSLSNSKPQPKCTFASPEKPLTLSANVQDEIQTNFLLLFFPPFIFKQMLWIFILLYKICRKRQKKFIFPPTKLSVKELRVNSGILVLLH